MARGRTVGHRGSTNRQVAVPPVQREVTVGALAVTGGVRGAGQARLSARGTQRAKPLPNLPGEEDGLYRCQRLSSLTALIIDRSQAIAYFVTNLLYYQTKIKHLILKIKKIINNNNKFII